MFHNGHLSKKRGLIIFSTNSILLLTSGLKFINFALEGNYDVMDEKQIKS